MKKYINPLYKIYKQQMLQIEDELTPFGVIDTGDKEEVWLAGTTVWSTDPKLLWKDRVCLALHNFLNLLCCEFVLVSYCFKIGIAMI